jgi:ribosomal protein S18 acetylase RimI-like enzyme
MKIRPLKIQDWPDVIRVHDAARPDELKGSCDPRAFVPLAEDPEFEELKASRVWVAEADDRVVGFTAVDGSYLGWLYVHPDYYGRGLGRSLLQHALEEQDGESWTIVLEGNTPALNLYRSEGFNVVSQFESENNGYPCTCLRLSRPGQG